MSQETWIPEFVTKLNPDPTDFANDMTVYHSTLFKLLSKPDPVRDSNCPKPHPTLVKMLTLFCDNTISYVSAEHIYYCYFPKDIKRDHPLISVLLKWVKHFRKLNLKSTNPHIWKPKALAIQAMILYRIFKCINNESSVGFMDNLERCPHSHITNFLVMYSMYQKKARDDLNVNPNFYSQESCYEYESESVTCGEIGDINTSEIHVKPGQDNKHEEYLDTNIQFDDSTVAFPTPEVCVNELQQSRCEGNVEHEDDQETNDIKPTKRICKRIITDITEDVNQEDIDVTYNDDQKNAYETPKKKRKLDKDREDNGDKECDTVLVSPTESKKCNGCTESHKIVSTHEDQTTEILRLKYELLRTQILLIDNLENLNKLKQQLK